LLVIVLAVIVGTWVGLRLHWKAQIRREVAAIKASGWPVTMVEVDRSYTVPEGVANAADIYLEALVKMVGGSADLPMVGTANLPGLHEHLDPNTAKAVAEYLEENKECLDLLHMAVDVEHCRYPKWNPDLVAPYVFFGLADKDAAKALEVYRRLIELADYPPEQRLAALHSTLPGVSRFWGLAFAVAESYPRSWTLHMRVLARDRAAQAAVAIERFRLANSHLPEDLAALVPTYMDVVPKDPFDGKPLRYLKRDRGFVVYSVDEDLTDNQGTRRGKNNEPGDITFTVER
jgi:hypothetical protein